MDEEPTADEAPPPDGRTWLPIAAAGAVVVVLVAVVVFLSTRQGDGTVGRVLTCPAAFKATSARPAWVPAKPSGVSAGKNLVPDQSPTFTVVCLYRAASPSSTAARRALSGHKQVAGDLDVIRKTLRTLPRAKGSTCPGRRAASAAADYLVGLTYATGSSWISVPADSCAGASNGSFHTSTELTGRAAAAYRTGRWPSS